MGDRISELEERIAYLESINGVGYDLRDCILSTTVKAYQKALSEEIYYEREIFENTFDTELFSTLSKNAKEIICRKITEDTKKYKLWKDRRVNAESKLTEEDFILMKQERQLKAEIEKARNENKVISRKKQREMMLPIFTDVLYELCGVRYGALSSTNIDQGLIKSMPVKYRNFDKYKIILQSGKILGVELESVYESQYSSDFIMNDIVATTNDIVKRFQLDSPMATTSRYLWRPRSILLLRSNCIKSVAGWDFAYKYEIGDSIGGKKQYKLIVIIQDSFLINKLRENEDEVSQVTSKTLSIPSEGRLLKRRKRIREELLKRGAK
jgi:hypothetical protein